MANSASRSELGSQRVVTVPDVRSFGFRVVFQPDLYFILFESTANSAPETAQATSQGFDRNRDPEQTCRHRRRILKRLPYCHGQAKATWYRECGSGVRRCMARGKTTGEAREQAFMIRRSFVERPEIVYFIWRQYHFSSLFLFCYLVVCFMLGPAMERHREKGAASATATGLSCSYCADTHGRVVVPFSRL